ncbi:MAG: hypothetical protein KC589_07295 [Nanoarchaeota archaeon]|nr:hypothetical protein [Nanoarchaeota archaeon]
MPNSNISYRHFRLKSGNILTITSRVNWTSYPYDMILTYGIAIFDKRDKKFTKKYGNQLSKTRLDTEEISIGIFQSMENIIINHSLISLRIIDHLLSILDDFENKLEVYPSYLRHISISTTTKSDLKKLQSQLKDKILLDVTGSL